MEESSMLSYLRSSGAQKTKSPIKFSGDSRQVFIE